MDAYISLSQIDEATAFVRSRTSQQPRLGIILGSGLNALAEAIHQPDFLPYREIPHFPTSTIQGHAGRLVVGKLEGQAVLVMQGRVHFYEGYGMDHITLPVRVMQRMGVDTLIVTNAAGGVNPAFQPGDVMLITDHLNLMGMTGQNPLIGPNLDEFGPRFPDMSRAYDRDLAALARKSASANGVLLREGVYAGLCGPSFESPADLRFLHNSGVDAVGMSTVPEVIVARHGGIRVLGLSGISNKANLDGSTTTTHAEVIEAGKTITPKIEKIIRGVLADL
jgi:purine-nucleoside phosphorylase